MQNNKINVIIKTTTPKNIIYSIQYVTKITIITVYFLEYLKMRRCFILISAGILFNVSTTVSTKGMN